MSRCGYDGLPERTKHLFPGAVEMPLPSYEEVVGGIVSAATFKPDARLGGGLLAVVREDESADAATTVTYQQQQQLQQTGYRHHQAQVCGLERPVRRGALIGEDGDGTGAHRYLDEDGEAVRQEVPRSNKTAIVLALLGLIIVPMCAMIIILQIKVCASPHKSQQAEASRTAESNKLLDDYKRLFFEKERLENTMRNLVKQLNNVTIEKDKLQQMLNINKTTPKFNSTTEQNGSTQANSTTQLAQRKKTVEEHLNELLGKKINGVINSNEFLQTVSEAQKIFQSKA